MGAFERHSATTRQLIAEDVKRFESELAAMGKDGLEGVMQLMRLWRPGDIVTVAFLGGSDELRERIAGKATEWTKNANILLSFRSRAGRFREWATNDVEYSADIRILLEAEPGNYASLVGNESRDPKISGPGTASMTLGGFVRELPERWGQIVLHEFGHALGFHHEHQHPVVPCDFRMDDDPGYVLTKNAWDEYVPDEEMRQPGVYTMMKGAPYRWSRDEVDLNIATLKEPSRMFLTTEFDNDSVMKYETPAWLFKLAEKSPCWRGEVNERLSALDMATILKAYPFDAEEIRLREELLRRASGPLKSRR